MNGIEMELMLPIFMNLTTVVAAQWVGNCLSILFFQQLKDHFGTKNLEQH